MIRRALPLVLLFYADAALAESVTLPAGTKIPLATISPLTSKKQVKGDQISLITTEDVRIEGHIAIPGGTKAIGQISDSRVTGGFGMNGKLAIAPLYMLVDGQTIRLEGLARSNKVDDVTTAATGIVNLFVMTSGKSGVIPAGTTVQAATIRDMILRRTDTK